MTLHHSNIALLRPTRLYITLSWFYFTLLDSVLIKHGSTLLHLSLHNSTMPLLYSTWLIPWLNALYLSLHISNMALLNSISLYITQAWLYFHSTRLYINRPWINFTLLDSTYIYHGSTSLYSTLHNSSMTLLHSTDSTLHYHGSTSLYLTLYNSTMALLHSTNKIIYLPRESRRTTSPEYPASVQRRTFNAGRAEQASNSRTWWETAKVRTLVLPSL